MKRIISSILVVVMLVLTLVGCGYSINKDDMTKYADFSTKAAFEELLKKILIEDGDFTTDDATREAKVLETIYSDIASKVIADATTEKNKTGTPSSRDVVYYAYYASAVFDDVTAYFFTDKYKSSSSTSLQLRPGRDYGEDAISAKVAEIFESYNFDDYVYTSATSGKTVAGDIAYVTFAKTVGDKVTSYTNHRIVIGEAPAEGETAKTFESYLCGQDIASSSNIAKYEEKDESGNVTATYSSIKINWVSTRETVGSTKEGDSVYVSYTKKIGDQTETVTNKLHTVGAAPAEGESAASFESYLAGKKFITTLDKFTAVEDEANVEYTNVVINWRVSEAKEIGSFTNVTYEEEYKVKDTTGTERDLKDVELTYYVYPVYYISIPEYSSTVIIDIVLGSDLKADSIYELIFAKEIMELDDDATEADRQKIKDDNKGKYKTSDGLSIEDMVSKIVKYYTDIKTAQTALDNADEALAKAETAYDEALAAYEAEKNSEAPDEGKLATLKDALDKADEALNGKADEAEGSKTGAKANRDKAQESYDKIGTTKAENIKKLLDIVGEGQEANLDAVIYRNNKILTYEYLQNVYNEEIRSKLATEIYFFITENIKVKTDDNGGLILPEKAVKEAYTQIYETYENEFYTGYYDESSKVTNYVKYKSFDKFLIQAVSDDIKTVETVKDAKAAIMEKAREDVSAHVQIVLAAQSYDLALTDKEYKEYKDELEEYYAIYVLYYKNFSVEEMLGKTNMIVAAQFIKLMDYLLDYEEDKKDADENGYIKIEYKYNSERVAFDFGEPASEKKDSESAE